MVLKVNIRVLMAINKIDNVKDLAIITGISVKPLYALYREKDVESIKLGTLIKICDALKCTLSELIEYI